MFRCVCSDGREGCAVELLYRCEFGELGGSMDLCEFEGAIIRDIPLSILDHPYRGDGAKEGGCPAIPPGLEFTVFNETVDDIIANGVAIGRSRSS